MMDALRHGKLRLAAILSVIVLGLGIAGCGGSDGDDGAAGAAGPAGADGTDGFSCWDLNENGVADPEEDLNGDGVVNVLDCNATANARIIPIGDGADLTEEQIETLGRLVAEITGVTIASPPVVDFTVVDSKGDPAVGIAEGVVWFTMAKLVPGDSSFNGGLPYWQSYVNRIETPQPDNPAGSPNVLDSALQATTDNAGTLEELEPGVYQYTFATDITDPDATLGIEYEPGLTTRVGLEIRLDGEGEVPLAPFNPVYDFVPDGGAGSGVTKEIADTMNCSSCHSQFTLHGGPRKTVEYCVTCHNPGSIDQDTGESIDMAYLAHSVHPGHDRAFEDGTLIPYIVWGYGEQFGFGEHDYSEVTYPQSLTYCENCHEASEATPDGDAWNEAATAKTCGGCHADGLVVGTPDAVTGQPDAYSFDHQYADTNVGIAADGSCGGCHLGSITNAGPALDIHRAIDGDDRFREELGQQFVFSFVSATNTGAGQAPTVVFRVDKEDGTAWDIVNDPEFDGGNGSSLNLYLAWNATETYNGSQDGTTGGARDRGPVSGVTDPWQAGHPYRVYLAALQADAVQQADGSYQYTFFKALPADLAGDVYFALGGHPAGLGTVRGGSDDPVDDGTEQWQRGAANSMVFYPGDKRDYRADNNGCNGCHQQIQLHGSNRNGNTEMCLVCHNADQAGERGGFTEGWGMGYMVHNIHSANPDWWAGNFAEVTYPQSLANCFTCHTDAAGSYSVARPEARAVSLGDDEGGTGENFTWLDDIATTPNAAVCGACHRSTAAEGHFLTNGAQVEVPKQDIVGVVGGVGFPNGQEACAVCHGAGSTFDTALFHNTPE